MADPLVDAVTPDEIAGLSEEPELQTIPNGQHTLVIKVAKKASREEIKKKDGSKFRSAGDGYQLVLVDPESEDFEPIFDFVYKPNGDQDAEDRRQLKRIFHAAGVALDGDLVSIGDLVGKTVLVTTRSSVGEGGRVNVNVRWPVIR